ncbi:MAG TPA: hypothetical protein VJB82_02370 [Candidatus Peribacterales bacterium]|nr:hypothetical protein [Candidatus Peribacterales bacterium]
MCCPTSPTCVVKLLLRISFGVSLALVGVAHYMSISVFASMVSQDLGFLTGLGTLWGYVLPALQIVGGVLIVANYRVDIGVWAAGVALASIAIGMLLKPILGGVDLSQVMSYTNDAFLWLLLYFFVVKCCLCGSCKEGGAACCSGQSGGHSCAGC